MNPLTEDQLHHLSKLYSVSFTETELHLLTTPTSSGRSRSGLTGLESQRAYLLHLALEPMECPACHGITCLRASALNPDANGSGHGTGDFDYACHHCKAKLRYHLGLIAGEQWWSLQPGQTVRVPS